MTSLEYKLKLKGTIFQKLVWKELIKIKYGTTKTYNELAIKLNTSPRAIGNACSRNRCLIIIPCHRVVCSNGSIGGFILGEKVKNYLINLEQNGT